MASVFKRGKKWLMAVIDRNGKQRTRSSGTSDKAVAMRLAGKWEADEAARRDNGDGALIDTRLEEIRDQGRLPIEAHIIGWETKMLNKGDDPKHVKSTCNYVRMIFTAAKIGAAADITEDKVNAAAKTLREEGLFSGRKRRPMSARTVQAYLTACKGFTKWLTTSSPPKLARDPLAGIARPDPKKARVYKRRMLLPAEWEALRTTTAAENLDRFGMPAAERLLLYATAIYTGLRSFELRSVSRRGLALDSKTVVCDAEYTKNGQTARQHIKADLADALRAHVATKLPRAPVFAMPDNSDVAPMVLDDLAAARAAWVKDAATADERLKREQSDFLARDNSDREYFDFHALRHTCGAWLAIAGVHPKTVQTIMRHSTITLTMDTYGHLFPGSEADAVERLPDLCAVHAQYRGDATQNNATQAETRAAAG